MGNRQFYNQMIIDACQQHQDKITNELDINTMKDVMQVNINHYYVISFFPISLKTLYGLTLNFGVLLGSLHWAVGSLNCW